LGSRTLATFPKDVFKRDVEVRVGVGWGLGGLEDLLELGRHGDECDVVELVTIEW
jgi:hypothetical protein